ncbi:hypothetical protein CspHIS471_0200090 [Cutaneotrichosporon sp. HIS471]|nr:hypothetical protein CspHIS471_0200090 [Cutaneotrichosporon sp. HIS471]
MSPRNTVAEGSSSPGLLSTSRKRRRTSAACAPCRSRKQSCTGEHPCERCTRDGRKCYYGEPEQRTPLTRQRMTQLEERVEQFDELWAGLFAGYPVSKAVEEYRRRGKQAVLDRLSVLLIAPPQRPVCQSPSSPARERSRSSNFEGEDETLSLSCHGSMEHTFAVDMDDNPILEWNEDLAAEPNGDGEAGMGNSIHGRGTTFFGLSSGAVFLRVIRKLCPATISGFSPADAAIGVVSGRFDEGSPLLRTEGRGLPLPPYSEIKGAVDAYFSGFHQLTPVVHEPTVRAQLTGAIPVKRAHTLLLNMVFAMGTLDSGTRDGSSDDGRKYYLIASDVLREDMLRGGSLAMVQGLCIMGNYLQRSGRPNAGYIALGWALRMGMALGLHTPLAHGSTSPLERETRLRVWWCLATTEAGCSVTFGRPPMAGAFQLDATPLVVNCTDEDLTVMTEEMPPSFDEVTVYTALGYQSRLARASCAILDRILHSNPAPSIQQLRKYDKRILDTVASMPDYMRDRAPPGPHQLALHVQRWRTRQLRSILYSPLLLGVAWRSHSQLSLTPDVLEAIETCQILALENLQDIQDFVDAATDRARGAEWYTIFFAFQACLTLLLSLVAEPHHPSAGAWRTILSSTARWFRKSQSMATLGNSYASILEGVLASVRRPNSAEALGLAGIESLLATGGAPIDTMFDMDRFWQEIWGGPEGTSVAPLTLQHESSGFLDL